MEGGGKTQFDILLGGSERLPVKMSIMKFAKARAQEIAALTEAIEDPQKTALVFQRLPKIMRRRVMSHNAKRMPRRLREIHLNQLEKSGFPPKSKRPSRKHRRRPQNLLLEYNRRKRKFAWLETHIWHAKRFHMVQKWGYKLANFPNDKTYRACYRASANHCLLQDISCYCCIELSGPLSTLLTRLSFHTQQECGLTFAAKAFLSGTREGKVTLFRRGTYPFGALGNVTFLWKLEFQEMDKRTLWIWVHPAIYTDVLNALISTFDFTPVVCESAIDTVSSIDDNVTSPVKKKAKLEVSSESVIEDIQITSQCMDYKSKDGEVRMVLLKDVLNRFRLTGPLSQAILTDALNVSNIPDIKSQLKQQVKSGKHPSSGDIEEICVLDNKEKPCKEVITLKSSSDEDMEVMVLDDSNPVNDQSWWTNFYSDKQNREAWQTQRLLWNDMKSVVSPAQLSPHQVLALTIIDPRYQMPATRKKVLPQLDGEQATQPIVHPSTSACHSPIWNVEVRNKVTRSKIPNAQLNRERSKNLVPGFMKEEFVGGDGMSICPSSPDTLQPARVPILLIQRPGSQDPEFKRLGFECGWDLILPAGWAMPMWLALVFRGARVGGLRQAESLVYEAGGDIFAPDTAVGMREADFKRDELADKHFSLPPAKRPNYLKLGAVSPFKCCWDLLVQDWCGDSSFYVLRDRKRLDSLKLLVRSCLTTEKNLCKRRKFHRRQPDINIPSLTLSEFSITEQKCLVPVKVVFTQKGFPSDFALICLPSAEDLEIIKKNPQYSGPVEPVHEDDKSKERKDARDHHQKLLRRLRRRRIKLKRKQQEQESAEGKNKVIIKKKKRADPPTKEIVEKHAQKMRTLWLPEPVTIKDVCCRTVLGFVSKGDFSFTEACGVGIGYVVLPGLFELVKSGSPLVLVRNTSSLQYRFAALDVC
ncbi:ribonucleases P/MRP protein subunit POP1 [Anabrus simplex]|uniref:ribonucleases P/MRP protein subunit POP1 n=1 Tax=Anabrus simplex TaxID=316456 RepID=UPI0035A344B2